MLRKEIYAVSVRGDCFPRQWGGFWPCRIGNEIHAFGVDDIPGRAPGRYLRLTAQTISCRWQDVVCEPRLANIVHAAGVDIVRQSRISSTRSVDIVIPASGGKKGRAFIGKRQGALVYPHAPKRNLCRFCAGGLFSQTMGRILAVQNRKRNPRLRRGRYPGQSPGTISAPDGAGEL